MKTESEIKEQLNKLETLQSQGRKNPKRNIEMKILKWVLDIVPESDEKQPEVKETKEEVAVAQ